jgi:hypothetical protein
LFVAELTTSSTKVGDGISMIAKLPKLPHCLSFQAPPQTTLNSAQSSSPAELFGSPWAQLVYETAKPSLDSNTPSTARSLRPIQRPSDENPPPKRLDQMKFCSAWLPIDAR